MELTSAITHAIDECIEKGVLVDILTVQRAEVQALILEIFDKKQYENDLIEHAKAEGRLQGKIEGKTELVMDLVRDGILSIEEAAVRLNIQIEEFEKMM